MPKLSLAPGFDLFYLDCSPSEPAQENAVLLLHGLGATADSWQLQIPMLTAAGFRVLAPDTRGFGRSGYPGKGSIPECADDFAALLEDSGAGKVNVIGISMGGVHALQLALSYPERVAKLMLVNTFAHLRPASLSGWLYFLRRAVLVYTVGLPSQAQYVAKRIFPRQDQEYLRKELIAQILQANPKGYRAAMRALGLFKVEDRLGEIHAPTLVVTGENDTTVPPASQRILVEKIPGAQQVVIANAGHAVTVDQPDRFNEVMLDFLNSSKRFA